MKDQDGRGCVETEPEKQIQCDDHREGKHTER
jgi:hypothetical protein